jgi:hypothetical protein
LAKRGRKPGRAARSQDASLTQRGEQLRETQEPTNDTQNKLADFAEDLGALLGSAQAKATTWLDQRKVISEHLKSVRDTADRLLRDLGLSAAQEDQSAARRRGRPPKDAGVSEPQQTRRGRSTKTASTRQASAARTAPGATNGARKGREMSAETRRKMSEAAKRRWAARRRES